VKERWESRGWTRCETRHKAQQTWHGGSTGVWDANCCSTPCPTAIFAAKRQTISYRDQMQLSLNAFKRCHPANSHLQHPSNPSTARPTHPNSSDHVKNHVSTLRNTQIAHQHHQHPTTHMQLYNATKHAASQHSHPNSSRTTYTFTQKRTSTSESHNVPIVRQQRWSNTTINLPCCLARPPLRPCQ
jgi:hypothetical protein